MRAILGSSLGWLIFSTAFLEGASDYPTPVHQNDLRYSPYAYTGLITNEEGSGSGSVAIHRRLVLGCAHVNLADNNTWHPAGTIRWFWKWNQGFYPDKAGGILLTGYFYFNSYRQNVLKSGMASFPAYRQDFVANYSATRDTAGGFAASWVEEGRQFLTTGRRPKLISGYPAGRYWAGHPSKYRMHSMEFSDDMEVDSGNYLGLEGVETGPGNSGGPVWVWHQGNWAFAGVLVSGLHWERDRWSSIGVCSLDQAGWGLIRSALGKTGGGAGLFKKSHRLAGTPAAISDQASLTRTFNVSGLLGVIREVRINLQVVHARQGDLIVTLRSPGGRTVTLLSAVAKRKSSPANLTFSRTAVAGFVGLPANGTWTLTVKDCYRRDTGSLHNGSLEIITR